ncbi:MAG TPA: hypothetical protein VH722_08860 [Alphaproteobacteria bacterium]|jgi:hypothetical protein|nr:hypothetical protein [Alphaproteobacteria bacterium]
MKTTIIVGLVGLTILDPASAVRAKPVTVFTCAIAKKTVSVIQADGQITYHYGADGKDEMVIASTPGSGNVFGLSQRFAGMEYQLRFTKGEYSYIVYESEGNDRSGAAASSGLVVMQGGKRLSDRSCSHFTEFAIPLDSLGVPEDTDTYSAM